MSRAGITYEDVVQSAEYLLLTYRQSPTLERIRQHLGSGSYTTISKHLKRWADKRLNTLIQDSPNERSLPEELNQAVELVWEKLRCQTQIEVGRFSEETKVKFQNLNQKNLDLENENKKLLETIECLRMQKVASTENLTESTNKFDETTEKLAESKIKLDKITENLLAAQNLYRESEDSRKTMLEQLTLQLSLKDNLIEQIKTEKEELIASIHKNYLDQISLLKEEIKEIRDAARREGEECRSLIERQRHDYAKKSEDFLREMEDLRKEKETKDKLIIKNEALLKNKIVIMESLVEQRQMLETELTLSRQEISQLQLKCAAQNQKLQEYEISQQTFAKFLDRFDKIVELQQVSNPIMI